MINKQYVLRIDARHVKGDAVNIELTSSPDFYDVYISTRTVYGRLLLLLYQCLDRLVNAMSINSCFL